MSELDRLKALEDDSALWRQERILQEEMPDMAEMTPEEVEAYYLSVAELGEINLINDNMTNNQV